MKYNVGRGPKYDLLAGWIGSGKRVLDVGCGTGAFARRLKSAGNQVTGVEISEENYVLAEKDIKVYTGDFASADIRETFDIVLFGDVLEHMHNPQEALKKAALLAPRVMLCVPNFNFWGVKLLRLLGVRKMKSGILDASHVYYFNKRIAEDMIRACGLTVTNLAMPAPKKLPSFYNYIIPCNPELFSYLFIFDCKAVRELASDKDER